MTQKFISTDGLKVLWKQISLKDYPNNETLMAVIDAIDETKVDTAIIQPYLFNIDYDTLLKFNTNEIVFDNASSTSILGKAILGQMRLA